VQDDALALTIISSNVNAASGGSSMKNFLIFLIFIFVSLFAAVFFKKNNDAGKDNRPALKVYASSSFISQWGPGPLLKESFEKICDCRVDYIDGADSTITMQRLKSEGRSGGADVVLGFDQFDLELASQGLEWRKINTNDLSFEPEIKGSLTRTHMVPYDWGLLSFVVRKSDFKEIPKGFDGLLLPELKNQIVLEDPRTSSPGLQFLLWLIQVKGEEKAFEYLAKLNLQIHSYAPSWSTAYGLFQKAQVKTTFSYVTSPVYHFIEDKSTDVIALSFDEGHPVQIEFAGIPATCKNCELAEKFIM
jgi:thiamine transport system substrate-binding protein